MSRKKRKTRPEDLLIPLPPPQPLSPERERRERMLVEALERGAELDSGAVEQGGKTERRFSGADLRAALRALPDALPRADGLEEPALGHAAYLRWSSERLQSLFEQELAQFGALRTRCDAGALIALLALPLASLAARPQPLANGGALAAFALQLALLGTAAFTAVAWWRARAVRPPRIAPAVFATDADHPDRAGESAWLARTRRSLQSLCTDAEAARATLAERARVVEMGTAATLAALLALPATALLRLL